MIATVQPMDIGPETDKGSTALQVEPGKPGNPGTGPWLADMED